jgi:hydrogenase small subunit
MNKQDHPTQLSRRALFSRLAQEPLPVAADEALSGETVGERLSHLGVTRRGFMQFCAGMASLMALPPSMVPAMAAALLAAKPSVIYMSFQECTGCLESLVNSSVVTAAKSTTIENLLLSVISLEYQEALMASAGEHAEQWRDLVMAQNAGRFVLVVDGSIPRDASSGYFVSGGKSGALRFKEAAEQAGLIIALGTCATFGGLPNANPNPTGAISVGEMMAALNINKPLINVSGCPPIAEVITGVIMYYLSLGMPALDSLKRPKIFYGETLHEECYRKDYFEDGLFAKTFDDAGARKGYCLLQLGCKGPVTRNACTTVKWNGRTSFPMRSGHGCLGCAQPYFWDGGQSASASHFWPNGTVKTDSFYTKLPPGSFHD